LGAGVEENKKKERESFWRRTLFRCAAARRSAFVIFRIGITELGSLTQPLPVVVGACVVADAAGLDRWAVFD
jgi:hypothetical protein